jgi:hypothetical protein
MEQNAVCGDSERFRRFLPLRAQSYLDDGMPDLSDILVEARWEASPLLSRLA